MAKQTMKAKVLDFVESQGEARYTDIIKFIITEKFGPDAWENGFRMEQHYEYTSEGYKPAGMRRKNTNRGYFSGALTKGSRWTPKGYFLRDAGYGFLEKQENGLYKTIR
tara:strand:- start:489 stop:815 length:327 start_codon:yes stop_codon:yes gene_type:complete